MQPISQGVQVNTWKANESGGMSYLGVASIIVSDQANTITLSGTIPGISTNSNIYFSTFDYNPSATPQTDKGGERLYTQEELNQAVSEERRKWDIDDDGKKGLVEAVNALQVVSGVRSE